MKSKYKLWPIYLILTFSMCGQKTETEILFSKAESLESDLLKSLEIVATYRSNYETILKKFPTSEYAPIACFKLAKLNEVFGHYDEALHYYESLIKYYPYHAYCAEALLNLARIQHLHFSNCEEAMTTYRQIVYAYPKSDEAHDALVHLGRLASETGMWERAIDYFSSIIQKYPDTEVCDDLTFRIADIYQHQLHDLRCAEDTFQRLIVQYPRSPYIEISEKRLVQIRKEDDRHEE